MLTFSVWHSCFLLENIFYFLRDCFLSMCPRCSNRHYLLIAIVDQFLGLNLHLIHFSTLSPWMCNFCWHEINLIFSFSSEFYFLISFCSMAFYKFRFLDHLALFLEDPQFPLCLKHFLIHRNAMRMPARVIVGWSCHCATIHQHLKLFQNKLWNHHYELLISQYHTLHTTIGHVVTIFFLLTCNHIWFNWNKVEPIN